MKFQSLKGFEDIYSPEIYTWEFVLRTAEGLFKRHGFEQLLLPILESTELFCRSIGDSSDIVQKEMYTFTDKGGRRVTLRPEGTASAVRCYIEHSLYNLPAPQKFYYFGAMFRYERPQKGRLRQFYQLGAEVFGASSPYIDAEVIILLFDLLQALGLKDLTLELNSIGCKMCRPSYKQALIDFASKNISEYCEDCQKRLNINPLRLLDCKVPTCINLRHEAPLLNSYLCKDCSDHLLRLEDALRQCMIPYVINPQLVRGLDYYTRTTFEVTSNALGAQKAVSAGGRYDSLVKEFGGPDTPAIGFAIGLERLCSLIEQTHTITKPTTEVYVIALSHASANTALSLARSLRHEGIRVEFGGLEGSLKSQLRKADKLGAVLALIIGDDELASGKLQCKNLKEKTSTLVPLHDTLNGIKDALKTV